MAEARDERVPTAEVNRVLEELIARNAPPQKPGEEVKLLYASQIGTAPPTIAIVSNRPDDVPESYQRYLHQRVPGGLGVRRARRSGSSSPAGAQVGTIAAMTAAGRVGAERPAARRMTARGTHDEALLRLLASYLLGRHPHQLPGRAAGSGASTCASMAAGISGATNLYRVLGWQLRHSGRRCSTWPREPMPVLFFGPRVPAARRTSRSGAASRRWSGHVFSVFVGFKGGKGVATAAGMVLALAPWRCSVVAVAWAGWSSG